MRIQKNRWGLFGEYVAKYFIYTVRWNFVSFYNCNLPLYQTCSQLFMCILSLQNTCRVNHMLQCGLSSLYECSAVIYPRPIKCVAVVNVLNTYWKPNRAMSADLSFSFPFCPLLVPRCSVIFLMLLFPFSLMLVRFELLLSDLMSHLWVGLNCFFDHK